jgi:hypothetical protein
MEQIKNLNIEAFTIPRFNQLKPTAGKIKCACIDYDEKGQICGGEIFFILEEKENGQSPHGTQE